MPKKKDAKVSDLMGISDAASILGLSWWQIRRRLDKGEIEFALLPNGDRAPLKASVEQYKEKMQAATNSAA